MMPNLFTGRRAFSLNFCPDCQDTMLHKYGRCVHCNRQFIAEVKILSPRTYGPYVRESTGRRSRAA